VSSVSQDKYDFLIVGAGLYGSICAHELTKQGYRVLVIDKRAHIGGNCYTENVEGVHVHRYGAHIFHTNDKRVWDYVNNFAEFRQYSHNVIANYKNSIYNLPFNMTTFNQIWGVSSPEEAKDMIEKQRFTGKITNLEEQALSLVGKDVYERLIKGYTAKQWRKDPTELPAAIIKRLPVRFTYDNNYFNDRYQGMPIGGYTQIFEKLLNGIDVRLNEDYLSEKDYWNAKALKVIYTGPIDKFFNYKHGLLEYKSVKWHNELMDQDNYQGCAVMNYTDEETPHTRIIEHKWFDDHGQKKTYVSWEFPQEYTQDVEPFYPVNDDTNGQIYQKYKASAEGMSTVHFGGRLGTYRYYDMHQVVAAALHQLETNSFFKV
jgi:UDP-galactopyranose mutase